MSVHDVTVDDLAIVNLCLEREKRIRSRWQCIHVDAPVEEERKARVMRQPAAPWDNNTRIAPVRKFSRGEVIRNKMSKSLLHSRKSQMLAENEQWQARMRRLQARTDNQGSDMQGIVLETDASYLDWVDYEGRQISRTWRQMQRSMPQLSAAPLPAAFVALATKSSGRAGSSKKAKSDSETRDSHRRSGTGGRGGGREGMANVGPGKEETRGKDRRPAGKRVCGEGAGGLSLSREDLSNLHSICKEVLGPEQEIGPYSTMRIRGRGGTSANKALKSGSTSGSESEREERRDSRMTVVSMHEALTMRHLSQSFVEERTDSGGNVNCKGALTATRLENQRSRMMQYISKEPDQTEELKSLIKTLQEEKEVLLDILEQGAGGNQGQQSSQETLVGTGKRLGNQDLATEKDKESVLYRMDVPDAGREESLGRRVTERPAKPRAHVPEVNTCNMGSEDTSDTGSEEPWRRRQSKRDHDSEHVSPSLAWFRSRWHARRRRQKQVCNKEKIGEREAQEDPLALRARISPFCSQHKVEEGKVGDDRRRGKSDRGHRTGMECSSADSSVAFSSSPQTSDTEQWQRGSRKSHAPRGVGMEGERSAARAAAGERDGKGGGNRLHSQEFEGEKGVSELHTGRLNTIAIEAARAHKIQGSARQGSLSGAGRAFFSWQHSSPGYTSPSPSSYTPRMMTQKSSNSPSNPSPLSPGLLSHQSCHELDLRRSQSDSASPISSRRSSRSSSRSPFLGRAWSPGYAALAVQRGIDEHGNRSCGANEENDTCLKEESDTCQSHSDWSTHGIAHSSALSERRSCWPLEVENVSEPREGEGAGSERKLQGASVISKVVETSSPSRGFAEYAVGNIGSTEEWQKTTQDDALMDASRSPSPTLFRRNINDLLSPRISLLVSEASAIRAAASPGPGGFGSGPRTWARSPSPHKEGSGRQGRLVATPPVARPPGKNFRGRSLKSFSPGTAVSTGVY